MSSVLTMKITINQKTSLVYCNVTWRTVARLRKGEPAHPALCSTAGLSTGAGHETRDVWTKLRQRLGCSNEAAEREKRPVPKPKQSRNLHGSSRPKCMLTVSQRVAGRAHACQPLQLPSCHPKGSVRKSVLGPWCWDLGDTGLEAKMTFLERYQTLKPQLTWSRRNPQKQRGQNPPSPDLRSHVHKQDFKENQLTRKQSL